MTMKNKIKLLFNDMTYFFFEAKIKNKKVNLIQFNIIYLSFYNIGKKSNQIVIRTEEDHQ